MSPEFMWLSHVSALLTQTVKSFFQNLEDRSIEKKSWNLIFFFSFINVPFGRTVVPVLNELCLCVKNRNGDMNWVRLQLEDIHLLNNPTVLIFLSSLSS